MQPDPIPVSQVFSVGRDGTARRAILAGDTSELSQLDFRQLRGRRWPARHEPENSRNKEEHDNGCCDESRPSTGVPRPDLLSQSLQIGTHLRGGLVSSLAIFF